MDIVTLDFESFYGKDFTLKKINTSAYIRDPRFFAHMVGIKINDEPTVVYPREQIHQALHAIDWTNAAVLCHNTAFDGFILKEIYDIVPAFYYDTLSMARPLIGAKTRVSLDAVGEYLNLGGKIHGVLAQSKDLETLPPELYETMSMYCARDVELTKKIFDHILPIFPEDELKLIDLTLRMFCDPQLKVDVPRATAEQQREIDRKRTILRAAVGTDDIDEAKVMLGKLEPFADKLRELGVEPPTKFSEKQQKMAYAFAKSDLEFTALLDHPDERVSTLVEARLAIKSSIGETRAARFVTAGSTGNLPVGLNYWGAHTGRWSGGDKTNMQNLPRGGELRKSIIAPQGQSIVVADSGQIEARVTAWLAKQDDLLEAFRQYDLGLDRDAYCKFADEVYGRTITKQDELERHVGKTAVLGLGYQMGANRFHNTLLTSFIPVDLPLDMCKRVVSTYRQKNWRIAACWRDLEDILSAMAAGGSGSYRCIHYEPEEIWLPSGMPLCYPKLRGFETEGGQIGDFQFTTIRGTRGIYGGSLLENIVQALARIIVAKQMLTISEEYRVVMTTHDEIAVLSPDAKTEQCLDMMIKTMSTPLSWCPDLPLTAEGKIGKYYAK